MNSKCCSICGLIKPLTEYYGNGKSTSKCKPCFRECQKRRNRRNYNSKSRAERKQLIVNKLRRADEQREQHGITLEAATLRIRSRGIDPSLSISERFKQYYALEDVQLGGYRTDRRGCFYILVNRVIYRSVLCLVFKVGVTNQTVDARYHNENAWQSGWQLLHEEWHDNGSIPWAIERRYKEIGEAHRYNGRRKLFRITKNTEVYLSTHPMLSRYASDSNIHPDWCLGFGKSAFAKIDSWCTV